MKNMLIVIAFIDKCDIVIKLEWNHSKWRLLYSHEHLVSGMEWKKKSKLKGLKCSQSRHGFDVSLDSQVKELLSTWQEILISIGLNGQGPQAYVKKSNYHF